MLLPFCPEQFCRPGLGTGACSLPRGQGHDDTTWQWESFPVIPSHSVTQAYPLQKTAYRRANGGSGAPGVHEDVAPKFVSAEAANWQVCLWFKKVWAQRIMMNRCCIGIKMASSSMIKKKANFPSQILAIFGSWQERLQAAKEPKLVVRNTFLDLEVSEVLTFEFKHFRTKVNRRSMSIFGRYSISSNTWG